MDLTIRRQKKTEESNKAENFQFLPLVTPVPNKFPLFRSTIISARCTAREYVIRNGEKNALQHVKSARERGVGERESTSKECTSSYKNRSTIRETKYYATTKDNQPIQPQLVLNLTPSGRKPTGWWVQEKLFAEPLIRERSCHVSYQDTLTNPSNNQ